MVRRKSNYEPLSFEMTELPESNFVREFQPYDIDHRRHEESRGVGIGLLRRRARTQEERQEEAARLGKTPAGRRRRDASAFHHCDQDKAL